MIEDRLIRALRRRKERRIARYARRHDGPRGERLFEGVLWPRNYCCTAAAGSGEVQGGR